MCGPTSVPSPVAPLNTYTFLKSEPSHQCVSFDRVRCCSSTSSSFVEFGVRYGTTSCRLAQGDEKLSWHLVVAVQLSRTERQKHPQNNANPKMLCLVLLRCITPLGGIVASRQPLSTDIGPNQRPHMATHSRGSEVKTSPAHTWHGDIFSLLNTEDVIIEDVIHLCSSSCISVQ